MIWVEKQVISGKIEFAYFYFKKLNQTLFSLWWSGKGLGI
ncbi:hypothetical protein P700755_002243 [Psychroflexus torquis ATCC 700755]|uniref:Uncharacterized protein n=1 Tax=Psychroflexus torquis (strain ATCC 700755 / CIP 106069 / ACAM 623) TaxID=313595 RepID=K4IF75_PSYTT|nr:hypothetical protein P700755_002243 [Psychroflexus torquis ATCC 700755]